MPKQNFSKWLRNIACTVVFLFIFLPCNQAWAATPEGPLSKDSPLVIPAAAFVSDGFSPESVFFPFGGGYLEGTSDNYGCVTAPVPVPNEVTIEKVFASVYDNDPARNIYIAVRRVDNFSGGTDLLASMSTTTAGAFAGIQVISALDINEPEVSYPDYSYYITTCVGSSQIRIYSVRIYYNTGQFPWTMFLPAILQGDQ